MQTMSMIDVGTPVPEVKTSSKSPSPKDKPFGQVLNDQRPTERSTTRQSEENERPMARNQAESTAENRKAEGPETPEAKPVSNRQEMAEQAEKQPKAEAASIQPKQEKVQHLLMDLLKSLVAGNPQQPVTAQEEELPSTEGLLMQLVQQLDDSALQGEQVLAGVDLSPLVEQVQHLNPQEGDGQSLDQLVAHLVEQLSAGTVPGTPGEETLQEPVDLTGELSAAAALATGSEANDALNGESALLMRKRPMLQTPAGSTESLGKARQILQQAIDAVAGRQAAEAAGAELQGKAVTADGLAEDADLLSGQTLKEEVDPRFADLLKPRRENLFSESLRQRYLPRQDGQSTPSQTLNPGEEAVSSGAESQPHLSRVEIAELLNGEPRPAIDTLLRNVQQNAPQAGGAQAVLNTAKQMPTEVRMLNLSTGQQVPESQVFDQVVTRISGSFNGESGRMVLRLHPAELGSLRLDLMVEGDRLRANLHAQSQQVQEILERNLPQLRSALAEQGLKIDQFQVNVDQQSQQQGQFEHLARQQQQHQQRGLRSSERWHQEPAPEEQVIPLAHLMQNGGGGISLHV